MNRRKRVYIAGPISRGCLLSNVRQADEAFVALARAGFAPLNPIWSVFAGGATGYTAGAVPTIAATGTATGSIPLSHDEWLGTDLPWVECADAVLRLPGVSTGADLEVAHAIQYHIPVYTDVGELIAALSPQVVS